MTYSPPTPAPRHDLASRLAFLLAAAVLIVCCAQARAVEPIPSEKRITATVIRTVKPSTQPLRMPTDVAVDSRGRIYVADGTQDRIVRLRPDGQLDAVITEIDKLKLSRPAGICVDSFDTLWIADTGNHRILCINAAGRPQPAPASPQLKGGSHDFDPSDLAVARDGKRLYVVDKNNHRVLALTFARNKWIAMGSAGSGRTQFRWPFQVCVTADHYVYVSDVIGSRVQRISGSDRWAGEVGTLGVEAGQLYRPKGVAADAAGRVYVSDSTMNVVQVFRPDGKLEGVLCDTDGKPLQFEHPMGMCFDWEGRLYVTELLADRVAVISISAGGKSNREVAKAQ